MSKLEHETGEHSGASLCSAFSVGDVLTLDGDEIRIREIWQSRFGDWKASYSHTDGTRHGFVRIDYLKEKLSLQRKDEADFRKAYELVRQKVYPAKIVGSSAHPDGSKWFIIQGEDDRWEEAWPRL
jgi:hypothetical protein